MENFIWKLFIFVISIAVHLQFFNWNSGMWDIRRFGKKFDIKYKIQRNFILSKKNVVFTSYR